ncbi:hypothetical protein TNCV_629241 [Trichonephila clavipes]|nr:hypothetical protein TNCV_629241 [Trichonephila clavipes]
MRPLATVGCRWTGRERVRRTINKAMKLLWFKSRFRKSDVDALADLWVTRSYFETSVGTTARIPDAEVDRGRRHARERDAFQLSLRKVLGKDFSD